VQIVVLRQAQRELKDLPKEVAEDVFALFEDLVLGRSLSMPNLDFPDEVASSECFM
jgi:hypothetical protein